MRCLAIALKSHRNLGGQIELKTRIATAQPWALVEERVHRSNFLFTAVKLWLIKKYLNDYEVVALYKWNAAYKLFAIC